jgi:hypothetical protein
VIDRCVFFSAVSSLFRVNDRKLTLALIASYVAVASAFGAAAYELIIDLRRNGRS